MPKDQENTKVFLEDRKKICDSPTTQQQNLK